mmetsp:Transcript_101376/g.295325  ORF Transcript_101376/g.295325 Transcript_101376/m.295325 type:complete len:513 (-) Transcript_101376:82-1620(-)
MQRFGGLLYGAPPTPCWGPEVLDWSNVRTWQSRELTCHGVIVGAGACDAASLRAVDLCAVAAVAIAGATGLAAVGRAMGRQTCTDGGQGWRRRRWRVARLSADVAASGTASGAATEDEAQVAVRECAESLLNAVGDAEDAEFLLDNYVMLADPGDALGVITDEGMRNIQRHVEDNIPSEARPSLFVDLGSADGSGVFSAAKQWPGMQHYWGVELSCGRHRTAIRALDELWTRDPEAAKMCSLINDDILSVTPLLSAKAVFWVSNFTFTQELNNQLAKELDRYAPEGSLVFSGKPLPMASAEPFPGGAEIACPQSHNPSATVLAQRVARGTPPTAPATAAGQGEADFLAALRESFDHFAAPTRGVQVLATKAAAALSEALLREAGPEEVAALLWQVAGSGERRPEAEAEAAEAAEEREDLLAGLQEEAEELGLTLEGLRTAYAELESLGQEEDEEGSLEDEASPWRTGWHEGALDGVAPWRAEGEPLYVSWVTFRELGLRARRLLLGARGEEG